MISIKLNDTLVVSIFLTGNTMEKEKMLKRPGSKGLLSYFGEANVS